jgi:hypothetical protein
VAADFNIDVSGNVAKASEHFENISLALQEHFISYVGVERLQSSLGSALIVQS